MAPLVSFLMQNWVELDVTPLQTGLWLCILLLLSVLLLLKLNRRKNLTLPPSPPKLPIIGNLHQLLGPLLHRTLQGLSKKYGPLMLVHFGQSPALIVSSADMAREMMKTHDIGFLNRPRHTTAKIFLYNCTDLAFTPYGEYWRQLRKLCVVELLSIKRVQSFQYVREEEVVVLMNKIRGSCYKGGSVNLSAMLVGVSDNIASRCILGRRAEEENGESKFGEIAKKLTSQFASLCIGDMFPSFGWVDVVTGLIGRLKATFKELDAFLDEVIEEHRIEERDGKGKQSDKKDFVDILLQLHRDGMFEELNKDNLKAILMDMYVGGADTTSTTLEWVMTELIKNPNLLKRAQQEVRTVVGNKTKIDVNDIEKMEYVKCVIKESLRLRATAPLLVGRETTENVKMGGYEIPANTRVYVNAWAIQRDSEHWERPEEFIPERFMNNSIDFKGQHFQFIPFGAGRRGCPGMTFGVAVIEYVTANLLYWFDWKLPAGITEDKLDMTEANGIAIHRSVPLHLVPTLYSP
ncbi:cytochrome P450 71A1-like [Mangifera indica]|uniref:cytochrome P450 71A1-like n=1 Tax=Mangifera indica TaxID=29780 RepID=UPI001CF9F84A|nr:cytochrome P450 71A1-like [Mangifera indica]